MENTNENNGVLTEQMYKMSELDLEFLEKTKSPLFTNNADAAFTYIDDWSERRFGVNGKRGAMWTKDGSEYKTADEYLHEMTKILAKGYSSVTSPEYQQYMKAESEGDRQTMARILGIDVDKTTRRERDTGGWGGFFDPGMGTQLEYVKVPKTDEELDEEIREKSYKIKSQHFGVMMSTLADDFTKEERETVYAAIRGGDGLPADKEEVYLNALRSDPEKGARLHYLIELSRKNESSWARDNLVHPLEMGFKRMYRGIADEVSDFGEFESLVGTMKDIVKTHKEGAMWNEEERKLYRELKDRQMVWRSELSRRDLGNSSMFQTFTSAADAGVANPKAYVDEICARRMAREALPREEQLKRRKEKLMLRLATDHKPYDGYNFFSEAVSGALSSATYMATAAIPYVGFATVATSQFGNVRNDILMNGGDIDDAVGAQALLALGWAGLEKLNVKILSTPLTGLQKKAMLNQIANTAWKSGKIKVLGKYVGEGSKEMIAKTFAECVTEGLQGAVEGGTVQWWMPEEKGGGQVGATLSAAINRGVDDFLESIGSMGLISMFGAGINKISARRNALSVESVVDFAGKQMQVINIINGRLSELSPEAMPKAARQMENELDNIWEAHKGNAIAALDEMREKYSLTDDQARTIGDYLDLRTTLLNLAKTAETDEEAYAIAKLARGSYRVGQTTDMGDTAYDVVDLFRMISPDITVEDIEVDDRTKAPVASPAVENLRQERDAALKRIEEAKVGSQRKAAERELRRINKKLKAAEAKENAVSYPKMTMRRVTIPVGKNGETRSFVIRENNEAPDIHSKGYAQSAADAVKGAEGLKAGKKVSLTEFKALGLAEKLKIAITQEQYMAMSNEERAAYVSHFGLGGSGNFALLDDAGKEIFNSDAMVSLFRGKVGTPGARVGGNWTLAHEYTHGVVRFLRDIGAIDEGTVALMRRLFGEPTSDNELWNEEAMANGFAEFLRGEFDFKRLTPEERREAMGFFERVWDIIKDFFRRFFGAEIDEPPVMASKRKEAERAVFNAIRNGDLSGLDQYAGIEFEEEKKEESTQNAREAASKPSEEKTVNETPESEERTPRASTPSNTTKDAPKEPAKAETTATTDIAAVVEQIENPIATAANLPARTNTKMTIFTPGYEMEIECEMMWVPLNELAESTDDREVQMRDRSRRATDEQVRSKTRKGVFQPLALFPGKKSDDGAPIVGGGMKIISGHGRKRMLEQLASEGRFNEYLSAINAEAQRQGVPTAPEGMKNPVLVLRVTGGLDKKSDLNRFAELSNRWGGLERSGAELAESDARKITDALLRFYNPDASGNLLAASNRSFMAAFLKEVGATGLTNADGTPTPEAALRVQRALMTAIFGNDEKIRAIIQNLLEKSGELSLGNLQNALMRSAGKLLAMKRAKGSFDIVNDVREAAYHYIAWRSAQQKQKSLSFADYLSEQDMFAEVATPMQVALAKLLEVGRFGTVLDEYSKLVAQEAVDAQGAFDFAEKRTPLQLLGFAERNTLAAEEIPVTPDPTSAEAAEPVQTPPVVSEEEKVEVEVKVEQRNSKTPMFDLDSRLQLSPSPISTAQAVITPPEPETFTPAPLVRGTATLPGEGAKGIKAHQVNANGEPTTRVKELPAGAWNLLRAPYDVRRPPKASAQDKAGRGLKISNPPPVKWNDIFPHFQGNKTEMADRTSQAIRANMTKAEREHYTTVVDYFGGGGCWGLFHALANFPNAKTLVVNEFDPDRLGKIRLLHEIDGEVAEIAYKLLDERYEEIREAAKDSSSPSTVANVVESQFKRLFTDPTERAAIQAFIDCAHTLLATSKDAQGNAINDTRLGIRRAIDTLREDGRKAKEAADAFKAREGATIRYVSGDAVANADTLPHGDDVMAIADPPYYLTADYQQNTILGLEKVPDNWSYRATQEFLHKLVDSGDGLVYTDEAWWFKEAYSPDQQEDLFGGGSTFAKEQEILLDIINTLDHFDVAGRVVGRQEVLGVHHGHKINARTENGENGNAVRPDTIDNAGGGRGAGSPVLGVAAEPQGQGGRDGTTGGERGLNGERASVVASGRRALAREIIIQDIAASLESAANRIAGNDKAQKSKMAVGAFLPQEDSGSKRNALQDVLQARPDAAYNNHFTDTVASIIDIRGDAAHGTTYEKGGQISPETVTDIFKALNTDGETAALYEEVFAVANALKVEYFIDRDPKDDASAYQLGGSVHYHLDHLERKSNQYIADTILHEMIHAVTAYAIDIVRGEKIVNGITVSKELKDAVAELEQIYNDNKDWIHGEYGAESMDEFIAELSTASLRKKLSEPRQRREEKSAFIKVCEAIINALRKLAGKKQNLTQNELTRALNNLDKFLTHYEEESFAAYQEKFWQVEESTAQGASVDLDAISRLARYSVRQVREERMAEYAEFVSTNAKAWLKHAAKRLDERMKDAGYTEKVWHGTEGEDFNVFKFSAGSHEVPAAYFSYNQSTAENYAAWRSMNAFDTLSESGDEYAESAVKPNIRGFYINPGKVLDIDETKKTILFDEFKKILADAYNDGYNTVRVKGAFDDQGFRLGENDDFAGFHVIDTEDEDGGRTDILIVMQQPGDNAQARIKAADAVTFDDDELPIPLEMRVDQSMSDIRFSVQMGKKAREEASAMIRKYMPDIPDSAVEGFTNRIAEFETPKERKAALYWLCKKTIILPEDAPKVTEAIKTAERAKVDPMQYERPGDILEKFSKFRPKEPPINPDTVPELSDKRDMGSGVTTYLVQDDKAGQLAMRKIINTHWGKDANPWCLLQGDGYGNLSDGSNGRYDAWHYWQHYNALPKRVAFQDGKLLAFMATDGHSGGIMADEDVKEQWWDRADEPHEGIPMKRVTKGESEYGASTTTETIEIMQDGTEVSTGKKRESIAPDGARTEEQWNDTFGIYTRRATLPSGVTIKHERGSALERTNYSTVYENLFEATKSLSRGNTYEEITWRHDNYTDYKLRNNSDGVYVLYKYERGAFRETDVEYTSETVNTWRTSAEAALRRGEAVPPLPGTESASTMPRWSVTSAGAYDERHHVRRGRTPRNIDDTLTSYVAAQIMGGTDVTIEDMRKIVSSASGSTRAADILERAKTLANDNRAKSVAKAASSAAELSHRLGDMLETDRLNKALSDAVTMGAKAANPETGRKLQQAIERKRIRDLQAAEGFTAAEIMAELPIDLAKAVLAAAERERTPEELAKLEEARKEREEERKKKLETEEGAEELADEEAPMREPTETERKAVDDLLDRARIRNDLQREEEERKRAEKAKRDAEEAEGGESGDNNADGGGDTTDGTTLLPEDTVRRIAPVFESADVFSWFIIELTSDKTLEKHPELPSTGEMWKSPVAVRELKKTAADILRRLAKDTLGSPSINYARNLVDRAINELESDLETKSFNSVRRKIARIYTMIWDNAHRITKNELMKELEKTVSKLTQKGRFSYTQEEMDRDIPAKIERWAKWVLKFARMGEAKLQEEIANLEKLTSENPASEDGKMPTPIELAEAADKLAVAKVYGHLKGNTIGQMRDLIDQIASKLDGERQAFELRRAKIEEANKTIVDALVNALTQGKTNRRNKAKAKGIIDRAMESMISSIDQQMVDSIRFCTDPELRKKALEAIDELTILINEGGNRYRNALATAQEEIHDGLKACYGDAAKGIRHLHEELPEEIAAQFFRQSSDQKRTYGHLLQLYASCLQRDYAENIHIHGRDEQIAAMEAALTAQDKMFHTWAVNWYKHNRQALSDAVEEVTGLPVIAPDELYVPVRVETEPSGIPAEVVAWSPIPGALNRRVRHGLDFDENAHFLTIVNDQAKTRAQTIGYAMTGIILRDTIASRDVQTAARRNASPSDLNAVITHLRDILAQDAGREKSLLESLNVLRKWAARFNIAWNPSSALAQPASIPVWANVLLDGEAWGAMSVLKAMSSAATEEGRAAIAELRASDGYRARYALGWSEEVANVFANPNEPKLLSKLGAAYDKGMMLSQFTDAACSLWIAQGFYRHATDVFVRRGETIEEAKRKALALTWAAVEQTQQSGRTENLSALQRGRGKNIINAILQFKTAQVLQNSYIIRAIRDVRAGVPGAKGRLARAMFISTVWVPGYLALKGALWALIMGVKPEPDDEDEMPLWFREMMYSAVDGMAAPLFVTSAMAEAPLRKMLDLKSYGGKSGIAAIDTWQKLGNDIYRLMSDPITLEEELTTDKIIDDIWKVIGDVSAPIRHARRAYNNWSEE